MALLRFSPVALLFSSFFFVVIVSLHFFFLCVDESFVDFGTDMCVLSSLSSSSSVRSFLRFAIACSFICLNGFSFSALIKWFVRIEMISLCMKWICMPWIDGFDYFDQFDETYRQVSEFDSRKQFTSKNSKCYAWFVQFRVVFILLNLFFVFFLFRPFFLTI